MRGIDLKLKRIARRITVREMAEAMDKSSSRISHIEGQDIVTTQTTAAYLAALSKFRDVA